MPEWITPLLCPDCWDAGRPLFDYGQLQSRPALEQLHRSRQSDQTGPNHSHISLRTVIQLSCLAIWNRVRNNGVPTNTSTRPNNPKFSSAQTSYMATVSFMLNRSWSPRISEYLSAKSQSIRDLPC